MQNVALGHGLKANIALFHAILTSQPLPRAMFYVMHSSWCFISFTLEYLAYVVTYMRMYNDILYLIILCVQVQFIGEEALDQGGPKKEYWRLLAIDIMTKLCTGSDQRLTFEHDVLGLQVSAKILKTSRHTPIKQSITLIKQSITLIKQIVNYSNKTVK